MLLMVCSAIFFVGALLFIIPGFFWTESYKCRFFAAGFMLLEAVVETISARYYIPSAWWVTVIWYAGALVWLISGIRIIRRRDLPKLIEYIRR